MGLGLRRSNVGTWVGVGEGAPWGTGWGALLMRAAGCGSANRDSESLAVLHCISTAGAQRSAPAPE